MLKVIAAALAALLLASCGAAKVEAPRPPAAYLPWREYTPSAVSHGERAASSILDTLEPNESVSSSGTQYYSVASSGISCMETGAKLVFMPPAPPNSEELEYIQISTYLTDPQGSYYVGVQDLENSRWVWFGPLSAEGGPSFEGIWTIGDTEILTEDIEWTFQNTVVAIASQDFTILDWINYSWDED